jgi:NitT/TauT family transport system ATP-binding protein
MSVRISNLNVTFGKDLHVLDDVNLQVEDGEFITLVGPSGCGKSTILNAVSGILSREQATITGEIEIGSDKGTGKKRTSLGYVFQKDNLLPWRTVEQNVKTGMEIRNYSKEQQNQRCAELMQLVGLDGFEDYYPYQVSGGMRQRASLIRTLAYDPQTILMDEPFGALDAQTRMTLQAELISIWSGSKKTIIFVTHDLSEAITLGERVLVMSKNPGRVKGEYRIDLPHPRDPFQLFGDPDCAALQTEIWQSIRDEYKYDTDADEEAAEREERTS